MFLHAIDAQPEKPEVTVAAPGVPCVVASSPSALSKVADWKPDVIYAHGIADVTLETALAAQYPTVFFAHAYYGACVSGTKRFQPSRPARGRSDSAASRITTCAAAVG